MQKKKKKTAEEFAREGTGNNLMKMIIGKTLARHSLMSEEEYLKEIGFEKSGKTEEEAVRIAIMNVLVEASKEFLECRHKLKMINAVIELIKKGEEGEKHE